MSCEIHRGKFIAHHAEQPAVIQTFGSSAAAQHDLERIFTLARQRAATRDSQAQKDALEKTQKLFARFRALGIPLPSHSTSGVPRKDAQFGYAALHDTLDAIRHGKPLPGVAREILTQSKAQAARKISAVGFDEGGYYRCRSCGRFASQERGHTCPITADRQTLNRALMRRLRVPESAYGGDQALEHLLTDARQNGGWVTMRHGLTGETVEVTLDGLPLALSTGFVPDTWQGQTQAVELADGRVVSVLDASSLTPLQPQSSAVGTASAAYGLAVPANTPVASASMLPPVSYHRVRTAAVTDVSGGQAYDLGHFIGTEYRKGGSHGTQVSVYDHTYTVGERSLEAANWGSARLGGLEGAPKGGVAVGRTLVAALGVLAKGEVVETGDGQIQVYAAGRSELLAVYNPKTNIAGDTAGSPNASPEQMAAVIAHRALHPASAFDAALAADLVRLHEGAGTALAAADSAYLALKNDVLADGKNLTLGGEVAVARCPKCGRFAGEGHICPAAEGAAAAPAASTSGPVSVDVTVDTAPIADALRQAPPVAVQVETQPAQVTASLDPQALAAALRAEFGTFPAAAQPALTTTDLSELRQAMTQMAQAVGSLAAAQGKTPGKAAAPSLSEQRLAELNDRLAAITAAVASGTPVPLSPTISGGNQNCPRCGQFLSDDHTCPERQPRQGRLRPADLPLTAQEHILSPVTLPAPDPYLTNVPAHVGGDLAQALEEHIPPLDPNFELNSQSERILRAMSTMIQTGAGRPGSFWTRSFGLYGPPGTGKNTLARQLAASIRTKDAGGNVTQGLNYVEANITPESSMQELIGATVLVKDPVSGATVSKAQLGKLGLAAAQGSVICVNEIVRSPKLATALQSMIEDGEIQIDSPEGGQIKIPVHPATVFVCTWNPGYEGDAERPGQAPLSRMMPFRLDEPNAEEKKRRVHSFFASLRGEKQAVDENERRRQEVLTHSYAVPADLMPSEAEIDASIRLFGEVSALAGGGGMGERYIGLNSDTTTAPGSRQLNRFLALGRAVGWEDALETLKICCDQDDRFNEQWTMIRERFEAFFGSDGRAVSRVEAGQAPARS